MPFSAFARFGNGFRFSGKKPAGEVIYETLSEGMGDTYDLENGVRQRARLFAQSMCLAAAQYETERAGNNQNPLTADELLPALERDYQVVPRFDASKYDRRQILAARRLVTRGPRQEAVEDALRTLLGDDFIAYEPVATADAVTWPPSPGDVGVFAAPGTQVKLLRIDANISTTGVALSVPFVSLGGTDAPIPGEKFTVEPDSRSPRIEQITVESVSGATLIATFSKPHQSGAIAVRPLPLWISSKRRNRIIVTPAAASDPETRRKIHEQMKRQLRGVSQWWIIREGTFDTSDPALSLTNCVSTSS